MAGSSSTTRTVASGSFTGQPIRAARQAEDERGAAAGGAVGRDRAAVSLHHRLADGQAQAARMRSFAMPEGFEDAFPLEVGNPEALVADPHLDHGVDLAGLDA